MQAKIIAQRSVEAACEERRTTIPRKKSDRELWKGATASTSRREIAQATRATFGDRMTTSDLRDYEVWVAMCAILYIQEWRNPPF